MVQNNKITQEKDSHLITIISYLQVVDDGDSVHLPVENHGADLAPGSILRIELQDVVQGVASGATCIVLYYYTNCIGNHESWAVTRVSLFVPVIITLLSRVAPLSLDRGEGRAAEKVQEVAEGRRSSVLSR